MSERLARQKCFSVSSVAEARFVTMADRASFAQELDVPQPCPHQTRSWWSDQDRCNTTFLPLIPSRSRQVFENTFAQPAATALSLIVSLSGFSFLDSTLSLVTIGIVRNSALCPAVATEIIGGVGLWTLGLRTNASVTQAVRTQNPYVSVGLRSHRFWLAQLRWRGCRAELHRDFRSDTDRAGDGHVRRMSRAD